MGGNRCGHNRRHIRRSLVRGGEPTRPILVLREGARAFARSIVERPEHYPELLVTRDTDRRRRSERLEAIGLVVMALATRADLLSLRVVWNGSGLSQRTIARWTQLDERRVRRALFDLRWAGFARGPGRFGPHRIKQPVERYDVDGEARFRGKVAIRQLTPALWEKIGMGGWLREQQRRRYEALHPPAPPKAPPAWLAAADQRMATRAAVGDLVRAIAGPSERERPPD